MLMNPFSAPKQEIAQNISKTSELSQNTSDLIQKVNDDFESLNQSSESIGSIVDIIKEIFP